MQGFGNSFSFMAMLQNTIRPRYKWVDNIKMELGEMRLGDVGWDRGKWIALVNVVMNFWVP
jgi:hypothetical protein